MAGEQTQKRVHPIVTINYVPRVAGHLMVLVIMTSVLYTQEVNYFVWAVLIFQGLFWGHIARYISMRTKNVKQVELNFLALDSFLNGCWIAVASFSLWVATTMVTCMGIGILSSGGLLTYAKGMLALGLGALSVGFFTGFHTVLESSLLTQIICMTNIIAFTAVTGYSIHIRARKMSETRKQIDKANHDLARTNNLMQAASSTMDLSQMMEYVMHSLKEIFPFDSVAIQLVDEDKKYLNFYAAYGNYTTDEYVKKIKEAKVKLDSRESISIKVFKQQQEFYRSEVTPDQKMLKQDRYVYDAKHFLSVIMLPIVIKKQSIGVITFYSHYQHFSLSAEDIAAVKQYVSQIALIINNAKLFKESQDAHIALNQKKEELENMSEKLSHYLSKQVYDSIFKGEKDVEVGAVRKRLTIFFSDITGFTELTERLESELLISILNRYLTAMSEIAIRYGGTIDKYIGDAVLIFFGDPSSKGIKQDCLQCVKMALEMRDLMPKLREEWRDEGIAQDMRVRIGISSGYCTVGNFGSEYHMDYTIIGEQVNLAARLETSAPPGEILISEDAYLLVREHVECVEGKILELKGISRPTQSYRVLGLSEDLPKSQPQVVES